MKIGLRNKLTIEVEGTDRRYHLDCAPDSPLGEIYDALCLMRSYVIDRMVTENEHSAKAKEIVEITEAQPE